MDQNQFKQTVKGLSVMQTTVRRAVDVSATSIKQAIPGAVDCAERIRRLVESCRDDVGSVVQDAIHSCLLELSGNTSLSKPEAAAVMQWLRQPGPYQDVKRQLLGLLEDGEALQ